MRKPLCAVAGCGRPVHVKKHGLCRGHMARYYRHHVVGGPLRAVQIHPPAKLFLKRRRTA